MSMVARQNTAAVVPQHHPSAELLLDYAAGALGEAESLLVATHLTLCPHCRAEVARLESVGAALMQSLPPLGLSDDGFDRLMRRLDEPAPPRAAVPLPPAGEPLLPAPLRQYVGGALPWRRVMAGLDEIRLPVQGKASAKLLRVGAGRAMPQHTHEQHELTLVLHGAFHDGLGYYARGDVSDADHTVDHRPVADPQMDCICLAVTDAPLRLTSWWGRLVNPFVRY